MIAGAERYFTFAARTPVLAGCALASALIMLVAFPALPLGAPPLDLMPGYTPAELEGLMQRYGPDGRRVHAWASATLDTLFPAVYVTLFAGTLYRFAPDARWRHAAWIPIVAGLWDLVENAQNIALLLQYPALSDAQVACASLTTRVKHLMTPVYVLLGAAFLARAGWRRVRTPGRG